MTFFKMAALAAENTAYAAGNTTGLVTTVSPATGMALTSVKTAARLGKSYKSFTVGGFYNPCFYANSLSAGLSATSFSLQCVAYTTSCTCPTLALPLYCVAQGCGVWADFIDSTLSGMSLLY